MASPPDQANQAGAAGDDGGRLPWLGRQVVTWFCVAAALFHIYALGVQSPGVLNLRAVHLAVAVVLVPLLHAGWRGTRDRLHPIDVLLILIGLASTAYVLVEGPNMIWRYGVMPTVWDLVFGAAMLLLALEITRRTVGWPLVIIILILVLYSLFGSYAPGIFRTRSFSLERIISFLFSLDGLYGIPIGVSSTYVYLFILFGAMLRLSRAGDFYMNLSYSIAGRTRGGPAKVSIFASALFGTISGTGIANVVTTGALTIPLMIRTGLRPVFAGAIEAVASTGGQIMPPIMGAGAFLMAEFIRIPYGTIVVAAIVPATLYFLSVFLLVDNEAAKRGLRGLPRDQLPSALGVLKQWGHLVIPLAVLIYMLVIENVSPIRAALFSMGSLLIVSWLRSETRLGGNRLIDAAESGTKGTLEVITSCAAAGLITGLFSLTGLGLRLSSIVEAASGGHLAIALALTMVVTIILSMGLPTTAAYIVSAAVLAPALQDFGVEPLQAHFFIFYFACMSGITPPVALVAIPAASLAGANSFSVGLQAFRIAAAGFIIPYMFVYSPALLLRGEPLAELALAAITACIGVWALATASGGYLLGAIMPIALRLVMGAGALLLIAPGWLTDLGGLALIGSTVAGHHLSSRSTASGASWPGGET